MPTPFDFRVYDPVHFLCKGKLESGHIARKRKRDAIVVSDHGSEYRVPWKLLRRSITGRRRRVTLRNEELKSRFRPDDNVSFLYRSKTIHGTVERLDPKRAVVKTDAGTFRVSYGLLSLVGDASTRDDAKHLYEIERQAWGLMDRHGLKGWSFQFNDASRRSGVCDFDTKVIGLSRQYGVHANSGQVRNTILHEIAHALVGPGHHHDKVWRAMARSIGCTGDRCHDVDFAPPRYIMSCQGCGWAQTRNARRKGLVCRTCGKAVRFRLYSKSAWSEASASA